MDVTVSVVQHKHLTVLEVEGAQPFYKPSTSSQEIQGHHPWITESILGKNASF